MSDGSEGSSGSIGAGIGGQGVSSGVEGGFSGEQQASESQSYQDMDARRGIATLYSAVQSIAEKMKGIDSLQERLAPLFAESKPQAAPIEDYDGALMSLQKQVEALTRLFETDQRYRKTNYEQTQRQRQQHQQMQAQQMVAEYTADIDRSLKEQGYPGFAKSAALVRSYIENQLEEFSRSYNPSREQMQAALGRANSPGFWADVYVTRVLPLLNEQMQEYRSMGELRQVSKYVPVEDRVYQGRHVWR